jgi:hypothetical protein
VPDSDYVNQEVLQSYRQLMKRLMGLPIVVYFVVLPVHPAIAGGLAGLLCLIGVPLWASKVPATPGQLQGQICLSGCGGLIALCLFFVFLSYMAAQLTAAWPQP